MQYLDQFKTQNEHLTNIKENAEKIRQMLRLVYGDLSDYFECRHEVGSYYTTHMIIMHYMEVEDEDCGHSFKNVRGHKSPDGFSDIDIKKWRGATFYEAKYYYDNGIRRVFFEI